MVSLSLLSDACGEFQLMAHSVSHTSASLSITGTLCSITQLQDDSNCCSGQTASETETLKKKSCQFVLCMVHTVLSIMYFRIIICSGILDQKILQWLQTGFVHLLTPEYKYPDKLPLDHVAIKRLQNKAAF